MSKRNKAFQTKKHKSGRGRKKSEKKSLESKSQKATIIGMLIAAVALVVTLVFGIIGVINNNEKGNDNSVTNNNSNNNTIINNIINSNYKYQNAHERIIDLSYPDSLYHQGKEFLNQANYADAAECFEKALKKHEFLQYAGRDTARIQYALGIAYRYLYRFDDAIERYTEAIGILNGISNIENKADGWEKGSDADEQHLQYEIGYVHYLRGNVYLDKNDYDRAADDCQECDDAVMLIESNTGWEEWYSVAAVKNLCGRLCFAVAYERNSLFPSDQDTDHNTAGYIWTFEDAFDGYNSALSWKKLEFVPIKFGDDEIFVKHYGLSENGVSIGRTDKGEKSSYLGYWRITEKDAETATILINRAVVECEWKMFDDAIEDLEVALLIYQSVPANEQSNICDLYWHLAVTKIQKSALDNEGTLDESILDEYNDYMEKGLKYSKKWYGKHNPRTAIAYENVAYASMLKNNFDKAKRYFKKAKNIFSDYEMEEDVVKEKEIIGIIEQIQENALEEGYWTMKCVPADSLF